MENQAHAGALAGFTDDIERRFMQLGHLAGIGEAEPDAFMAASQPAVVLGEAFPDFFPAFAGMPTPVSTTSSDRAPSSTVRTRITAAPPWGVNLMALETRCASALVMRLLSPNSAGNRSGTEAFSVTLAARAAGWAWASTAATQSAR